MEASGRNRGVRKQTTAQRSSDILEVKRRVRERDGYACKSCGMTDEQHREKYKRTLDVHRVKPGSLYMVDWCITMCKGCHRTQPKRAKGEIDEPWVLIRQMSCFSEADEKAFVDGLAGNLRAERARKKMTLSEAAKASGVHAVLIGRYERGRIPPLESLYLLAEAYGVPVGSLLPDAAPKLPPKPPRRRKESRP